MSNEKKARVGGYELSAAPAASQAESGPVGDAGTPAPDLMAAADSRPRGRSQQVLPGILGRQLRAAYGELLNTPVPERISELVRKLEGAQPAKPASGEPEASAPGDEEAQK